jgi:D-arabinose 1-dehydrogenase-like Zn-dependent alcohol dehydrogenase
VEPEAVERFVSHLNPVTTVVVSGGARGVDTLAAEYARARGIKVVEIRPNWKKHGRAAGFHRNGEIVNCADDVAAFWNGTSNGTLDTVKKAVQANKPVALFDAQGNLLVVGEHVPRPKLATSIKSKP